MFWPQVFNVIVGLQGYLPENHSWVAFTSLKRKKIKLFLKINFMWITTSPKQQASKIGLMADQLTCLPNKTLISC